MRTYCMGTAVQTSIMCRCVVALLVVGFIYVSGEDSHPPHQQYLRAFENLPTLFDHIIGMLQEKPEILEKNDVATFFESAINDEVNLSPRENALNVFKRESKFEDFNVNSIKGYDWSREVDGDSEAFVGAGSGGYQLTADEVAERMLIAEKKLDEYHKNTN